MRASTKTFLILIVLVLVTNIVLLDFWLIRDKRNKLSARVDKLEENSSNLAISESSVGEVVVASEEEDESEAEIEAGVVSTPAPEATSTRVASVPKRLVKEVIITLGSASTRSTDWVDTGAQVYIDTAIYPNLKAAYLSASLKGDSGVAFARLMQKNEGTFVVGSEISHNTPTSTLKSSDKIHLSAGNKLYGVQLRSEVGQEVFVENARIRLVIQ